MKHLLTYISVIIFITLALISCQKKDHSAEVNPLLDKYLSAWNDGNLDILDEITPLDFELRMNPDFEAKVSRDLLKEEIANIRMAYPDFSITIDERLFAGDTAVVILWTIEATNTGEGSHPPTGRKVNTKGFSVIFFAGGKLTGEWIAFSDLSWLRQLGFTITPPEIPEE